MSQLYTDKGSQLVSLEDLKQIQIPDPTKSYTPVGHYDLAKSITTIGQDLLTDYTLTSEQYAIARQGNQLFAVLTFAAGYSDIGLSVGFRNSYDKSMSIGIAIGAQVFVCSNLAMSGQITVMKKHSANVLNSLEEVTINTLYRAKYTFGQLIKDSDKMKTANLNDNEAFRLIGLLYGHGVFTPRQLPQVLDLWQKPVHAEFQPRTAWSFYNASTEALKSSPPQNIMERHINAHQLITEDLRHEAF